MENIYKLKFNYVHGLISEALENASEIAMDDFLESVAKLHNDKHHDFFMHSLVQQRIDLNCIQDLINILYNCKNYASAKSHLAAAYHQYSELLYLIENVQDTVSDNLYTYEDVAPVYLGNWIGQASFLIDVISKKLCNLFDLILSLDNIRSDIFIIIDDVKSKWKSTALDFQNVLDKKQLYLVCSKIMLVFEADSELDLYFSAIKNKEATYFVAAIYHLFLDLINCILCEVSHAK